MTNVTTITGISSVRDYEADTGRRTQFDIEYIDGSFVAGLSWPDGQRESIVGISSKLGTALDKLSAKLGSRNTCDCDAWKIHGGAHSESCPRFGE